MQGTYSWDTSFRLVHLASPRSGQRVKDWAERADVRAPYLGVHVFRHSFATHQMERGAAVSLKAHLRYPRPPPSKHLQDYFHLCLLDPRFGKTSATCPPGAEVKRPLHSRWKNQIGDFVSAFRRAYLYICMAGAPTSGGLISVRSVTSASILAWRRSLLGSTHRS